MLIAERAGDLWEALTSKRSFSSYFRIISAFILSPPRVRIGATIFSARIFRSVSRVHSASPFINDTSVSGYLGF